MAAGAAEADAVRYVHLWADAAGETHVSRCEMGGLADAAYSNAPQRVRTDGLPAASSTVFTTLPPGFDNPWHPAPAAQWVVTLAGSWWVEVSDGTRVELPAGSLLFQDNVAASPAAKVPQHYSGCGEEGCSQLIVQCADFAPTVDAPGPF